MVWVVLNSMAADESVQRYPVSNHVVKVCHMGTHRSRLT